MARSGINKLTKMVALITVCANMMAMAACSSEEAEETSMPTFVVSTTEATAPAPTETTLPDYMTMPITVPAEAYAVLSAYAAEHGQDPAAYPQEILDMLTVFPDAREYAFNYLDKMELPEERRNSTSADMTGDYSPARLSTIYQWDTRWGYKDYCGKTVGLSGSGPTCVSICAMYLLKDSGFNPAWIADYAINNHYCDDEGGTGTYRTLITDGGYGIGIDVVQITNDEQRVKNNIDVGNPIICAMDGGIFGNRYEPEHYIIITDYDEEGFTIIDPGSSTRTGTKWQWASLSSEIQALWVYRIL